MVVLRLNFFVIKNIMQLLLISVLDQQILRSEQQLMDVQGKHVEAQWWNDMLESLAVL